MKQPNKYINIDRVEFIVTYRCNSHCKHCQLGEEKRDQKPASINSKLATRIVEEITREYSLTSVMTFGGEPLLFPETVCAIHKAAKENGIGIRQVLTNGSVPRNEAKFREIATRLADSGVNNIRISVDRFHQEYILLTEVERNVKSLLEAGINQLGWNPCWVVSKEDDNDWNQKTKLILQALEYLPVPEGDGNNAAPAGNALKWLSEFMPSKMTNPEGSCEDVPYANRLDNLTSICIEPDGEVMVCGGFSIGNAEQRDISEILRDYNPYEIPEMRAILDGGVSQLEKLVQSRGVMPDTGGYYSICDKCVSLSRKLSNP